MWKTRFDYQRKKEQKIDLTLQLKCEINNYPFIHFSIILSCNSVAWVTKQVHYRSLHRHANCGAPITVYVV